MDVPGAASEEDGYAEMWGPGMSAEDEDTGYMDLPVGGMSAGDEDNGYMDIPASTDTDPQGFSDDQGYLLTGPDEGGQG